MAKGELIKFISSKVGELVISGHSIAVKFRRDFIGATPNHIRKALEGVSKLNPGHHKGSLTYKKFNGVQVGHVMFDNIKGGKIIWIHGGGFSFGSPRIYKAAAVYLARKLKCEVFLPVYSLSPEYKYPNSLHEIINVYNELTKNGERIVVVGDSAGGNLATALTQYCINNNLIKPKKLVLLSPWLDLHPSSRSNKRNYSDFSPFDKKDTLSFGIEYAGNVPLDSPKVSPLRGSFADFPPTHVQVSKVEFLYDDSLECIEKLEYNNIEYSSHFEEKALHGWHLVPDFLPEASRSLKLLVNFLKSDLYPPLLP